MSDFISNEIEIPHRGACTPVNRDNFAQMAAMRDNLAAHNPAMAETFAKLTGFCATTDEAKHDPPAEAQGCKAASEAIQAVCRSLTSCYDDPDLADAILAAIRRGDVPGIMTQQYADYLVANSAVTTHEQVVAERDRLRAELEQAKRDAEESKMRANRAHADAFAPVREARAEVAQWKERAKRAEESQRLTQKAREDDRGRLQQKCSDWGTYWRAEDADGVNLTTAQAAELLQEALGVEVEIKTGRDSARAKVAQWKERAEKAEAVLSAIDRANKGADPDSWERLKDHTVRAEYARDAARAEADALAGLLRRCRGQIDADHPVGTLYPYDLIRCIDNALAAFDAARGGK